MNREAREYITELNQNYNDLGEDLVMLEAILSAAGDGTEFPQEYIESGLERIQGYIQQHTEEIGCLTRCLAVPPRSGSGGRPTAEYVRRGRRYFPRTAEK